MVGWNLVSPLAEEIGGFTGDLRLKIVKEPIARMPLVDVARILEQLRGEEQVTIFDWLIS